MNSQQIAEQEIIEAIKLSRKYLYGNEATRHETRHCFYTIESDPVFGEVIGVYTENTGSKRTRNFRVSLN